MTDDGPPFDLVRIVEVLDRHGVAYIAIGGVSGMLHGATHYLTQDVDMMVQSGRENLERIAAALSELDVEIDRQLGFEDLTVNTQWRTPSGPIDDLLASISGSSNVATASPDGCWSPMAVMLRSRRGQG